MGKAFGIETELYILFQMFDLNVGLSRFDVNLGIRIACI
jgi:hypothetical protein